MAVFAFIFTGLKVKKLLRNSKLNNHPSSTKKPTVTAITLASPAIREFEDVCCEPCWYKRFTPDMEDTVTASI
jgi:protein-disulfide isomerase